MNLIGISISVFHLTTNCPRDHPFYLSVTNYLCLKVIMFYLSQDLHLPITINMFLYVFYPYMNYGYKTCTFLPITPLKIQSM